MKYTFKQFQGEYPDDAACLLKIMDERYGGTLLDCPGCGVKAKFHPMGKRRAFACQECGHHIYPCAGTIFHKSSTDLTKWFFAMYLMTSTRHGVAAKELERQIGCTYKTAWRMAHELRKLMASADYQGPLSGHVEADEAFIGGKKRRFSNKPRGGYSHLAPVFGMVERGGNIRTAIERDIANLTRARRGWNVIRQRSACGRAAIGDECKVRSRRSDHLVDRARDHLVDGNCSVELAIG